MFHSAIRFFFFLLLLSNVELLFAQPGPGSGKAWLKEYQEHHEYDGVYVVKKVAIPCKSYEAYLVDGNGTKLSPAFRDIGDFSEGLAEFVPLKTDSLAQIPSPHGFINRQGNVVIEPKYVATDKFRDGKTWVIYPEGKQFGLSYIDRDGKTLYKVPIHYLKDDFLISKAEVKYKCGQNCKEDVIWWKEGDLFILNFNFSPFIEREIKASKFIYHFLYQGKYGIIDKNMVLKVPVALDEIDPTYEFSGQGMERVRYGDKFGFINVFTGDIITPFIYTDSRRPTAGLFWVKKDNKWGCIDKTGKTRIPFLYDEATGFTSEDRSAVAINGKFGHIDKRGKIRTPLKYDFASYYNHGLSMVRLDGKYGYIDTTGRFVTEIVYEEAMPFDKTTTLAERSWLRYELAMDGTETFVGFSYKLNAIFILIGLLIFVRANSYFFSRFRKGRAVKQK